MISSININSISINNQQTSETVFDSTASTIGKRIESDSVLFCPMRIRLQPDLQGLKDSISAREVNRTG